MSNKLSKQIVVIFFLCCLSSCNGTGSSVKEEIAWSTTADRKNDVYGEDSRLELNDPAVASERQELGQSVALVLNVNQITNYGDEQVIFNSMTMNEKVYSKLGAPLCEDEPFRNQPAPGHCTAFLIKPDLIATAGHCVNGHTRCSKMAFAFDYTKKNPTQEITSIKRKDLYRCEALIGRLFNPLEERDAIESREYWFDWAVMRLDRPVEDREPLVVADETNLNRGAEIFVIGHPSGVAMKVASGFVTNDDKQRYLNTSLDIYQGNSGSPAFNPQNAEVEGIAIRGSGGKSFEVSPEGCVRSKHCEEFGTPGCTGNHVLKIDPIKVFTEDFKLIERHRLTEDDSTVDFREHYQFDEMAEVRFATVHLNAYAQSSEKLRVILHHNDYSVEMMHHPHNLPYGRWTATSEGFSGRLAAGDWWIELIDEGGGLAKVEWSQIMLGVVEL